VGGAAAGEHGGQDVEGEGETRSFPEADGEWAGGAFDGGGVCGEGAGLVVAAGDGELLAAFAVGGEGTVGELRHGHVEDDGCGGFLGRWVVGIVEVRDGEDERVVAEGWGGGSPGREVGEGVGPAHGGEAGVCGLPAVGAGALPMGGFG